MATMVISIHVPKTGGVSFRRFISEHLKVGWDYDMHGHNAHPPRPRTGKDIIHGHFFSDKYDKMYPNAQKIAFVRDPAQRMMSNYLYILREPDRLNNVHNEVMSKKLSFEEFIEIPDVQNEQSRFIGDVTKFSYIGIVESYDESVKQIAKILGIPEGKSPKLNSSGIRTHAIPSLERVKELNKKDYKLYNKVKQLWHS